MSPGTIRVSLDFECGWGVIQGGGWRAVEYAGVYRDLRPALLKFTRRMDELELSFTWAVVGAMIEDPTHRDLSHLRGHFAEDVQIFTTEAEQATIDGRDLLDIVTSMRTKQSFGTHTYSHLLFSDTEQTAEVITKDLAAAIRVNNSLGLDATRLVFPRNHAGYFDEVRSAGITHARMPALNTSDPTNRPGLIGRALSLAFRPISPVLERCDRSGLVLHHASELLNWGATSHAAKRFIQLRRTSRAIALAAKGADVHFWLHPFDLVQTTGLADEMDNFLMLIAQLRERNLVRISGF